MAEKRIKLPNGKTLIMTVDDNNIPGLIMVETVLKCIQFFPKNMDIDTPDFWKTAIEKFIGSRNALYIIKNIFDNIVTPIERDILESRNYPVKLLEIIYYMCKELAKGRVDDWNDLNFMRIRNSEIITALLQKQISAAYSEYKAKLLRGDKTAEIYINSTKVLSEILTSPNVQILENINPVEELSMITKITPVGIGGVKNEEAWPKAAKNIHPSYYGNIDALDSPQGPKIGTINFLTLDSGIMNNRGLFTIKNPKNTDVEETLSPACALVPFINYNESVRIATAVGQSRQVIPLKDKEVPMVQTGYESILASYLSDFFVRRSDYDGIVVEINEEIIKLRTKDGFVGISLSPAVLRSGQGKFGLGVFTPIVKVGQKITVGQIVAEGGHIKDGMISMGRNLLAAFMPWYGYNFEDGMVISESAAGKFASEHLAVIDVMLKPDDDVEHIAELGSSIKKGGLLISYSPTIYDSETLKNVRSDPGIITEIEIYSNVPENELPEKLRPVYDIFVKNFKLKNGGKYPVGNFKMNKNRFEGIYIKFLIRQVLPMLIGDKLNNRIYNKGICFDRFTEVFTKSGWKKFSEIDMENDEVAYIKNMETFESGFIKPLAYHEYDYNGTMYGCKGNRVDYLVTPDHNMYVATRSGEYRFEKSEQIHRKHRYMKNVFENYKPNGDKDFDINDKIILENNYDLAGTNKNKPILEFNKKDFYEFLGMWIAEGCVYNPYKPDRENPGRQSYKVIITQSDVNMDNVKHIENLINKLNLKWYRGGGKDSNFIISHKPLFEYLSKFGKCKDKYIPEEVFHSSRECMQGFFNNLVLGDGSRKINKNKDSEYVVYFSISKRLINDVARLATLLGYTVSGVYEDSKNRKNIKYCLRIRINCKNYIHLDLDNFYTEEYNDKVYCLTVPNNLLYVRRNYKPLWCGNCSTIVPDHEMPYIKELDKHLDIVYSTLSVVNRTNPGQLYEMSTGLIAKKLGELAVQKSKNEFIKLYSNTLKIIDGTPNQQYSTNLISRLKSMSDLEYKKYVVKSAENNGFIPIMVPPFKSPSRKALLSALHYLGLKPNYKTRLKDGRMTKEVSVGYMYVYKLEHQGDKKIQSRSTGGYTTGTLEPIAQGARGKASKSGEYDIYSLLAWDCPVLIDELLGPMSNDHKSKNELIAEIINTGKGSFKISKSNPTKDLFYQYLTAMHLEIY